MNYKNKLNKLGQAKLLASMPQSYCNIAKCRPTISNCRTNGLQLLQYIIFLVILSTGRGVYIPYLKKIAPAISEIRAAKVWVFLLHFSSSTFRTLYKI